MKTLLNPPPTPKKKPAGQIDTRKDAKWLLQEKNLKTMDGNTMSALLFFFRVVGEPEKSLDEMEKENLPTHRRHI